tara:strand:+ start:997 stop:1578 length:582 start_codon:yes stop_codon:yes gene_type:complete
LKDFKENVQSLMKLCRQLSLQRLQGHIGCQTLVQRECRDHGDSSNRESLSLVFLTSIGIKLNFKTHFTLEEARLFAMRGLGCKSKDEISRDMIEDFMKEYCNLFAGAIKSSFENKGFNSSISLPFLTRARDQIFFNQHPKTDEGEFVFEDAWEILMDGSVIRNQILIEIYDSDVLSKVVEKTDADDSGSSFFF